MTSDTEDQSCAYCIKDSAPRKQYAGVAGNGHMELDSSPSPQRAYDSNHSRAFSSVGCGGKDAIPRSARPKRKASKGVDHLVAVEKANGEPLGKRLGKRKHEHVSGGTIVVGVTPIGPANALPAGRFEGINTRDSRVKVKEPDQVDCLLKISAAGNPEEFVQSKDIDPYKWHKYGRKPIAGDPQKREYFQCPILDCPARRRTQWVEDDNTTTVWYFYGHCHGPPDSAPPDSAPARRRCGRVSASPAAAAAGAAACAAPLKAARREKVDPVVDTAAAPFVPPALAEHSPAGASAATEFHFQQPLAPAMTAKSAAAPPEELPSGACPLYFFACVAIREEGLE